MAPVKLTFFCVPKPTTTTSSSALSFSSSDIVKLLAVALLNFTVCGLKDRWEIVRLPSADVDLSEKLPLLSEDVLVVVPFKLIVAFSIGAPSFLAVNLPLMLYCCCCCTWTVFLGALGSTTICFLWISNATGSSSDSSLRRVSSF
ncbi:hypothetical protein D3C81_951690 [compost metagenome]